MSLMTHPHERMRKVPATNAARIPAAGAPPAAIHNAASVGHSSSAVPMGLSSRMSWA